MGIAKYIGIAVLGVVYLALCVMMFSAGGFNGRNLFWAVASGIIIFVPLWRKYFSDSKK